METRRTKGGTPFDVAALDTVERGFWRGIWAAAPADLAAERGIEVGEFGAVQATVVGALPRAQLPNLVLGADRAGVAESGDLARALNWAESRGASFYVPVTESLPGSIATEDLLRSRGYEQGYAWMKFVRDAHPPRFAAPEGVDVLRLNGNEEPFAMIAATGFGLPGWTAAFFADLPTQAGWHCYVARVDGEPAACAAMRIQGRIAEFGIAATLEPARGRGCQQALLHRRITDAAAGGCQTLFVETGERVPNRPSASYRNILKAGFEEAYLRPNWQRTTGRP